MMCKHCMVVMVAKPSTTNTVSKDEPLDQYESVSLNIFSTLRKSASGTF